MCQWLSKGQVEQMPVKIKVKTTIWNDVDKDTFELLTFGRYYEKGDSIFLQYEEVMEEGRIKSIVKVSEREALILRSGTINMRMVFQTGKRLQGRYETSLGSMPITTLAKKLDYFYEEDEKKGIMTILYDLEMQGSLAGTYQLEISFEEETSE